MKRKGLSIFLAVCLVFSMMTFAASAADDGGKVKQESISVEDTDVSFRGLLLRRSRALTMFCGVR